MSIRRRSSALRPVTVAPVHCAQNVSPPPDARSVSATTITMWPCRPHASVNTPTTSKRSSVVKPTPKEPSPRARGRAICAAHGILTTVIYTARRAGSGTRSDRRHPWAAGSDGRRPLQLDRLEAIITALGLPAAALLVGDSATATVIAHLVAEPGLAHDEGFFIDALDSEGSAQPSPASADSTSSSAV
jgi:hypothetical protein